MAVCETAFVVFSTITSLLTKIVQMFDEESGQLLMHFIKFLD